MGAEALTVPLTQIFNQSIEQGIYMSNSFINNYNWHAKFTIFDTVFVIKVSFNLRIPWINTYLLTYLKKH